MRGKKQSRLKRKNLRPFFSVFDGRMLPVYGVLATAKKKMKYKKIKKNRED